MGSDVTLYFTDHLERLGRAQTVPELQSAFQDIIESLGYAQLDYGRGRLQTMMPRKATDLQMTLHLATVNWTQHYIERGYQHVDRSVLMSITQSTPWLYTELFGRPAHNSLQREMEAEVQSRVSSGLAVPLHDWQGNVGILHLGSKLSASEFLKVDRETRPMVALMAAYFHERVGQLIASQQTAPALTEREKECLRWAGEGKTSWEIAMILRVSEATVKGHIGLAMQKLDVRTRAQAVARAMGLGIL
jgi:DNA-binding CsgD family transcriptional regulator